MIGWVEQRLRRWGEYVASGSALSSGRGGVAFPAYQMVHVQDDGAGSGVPVSADILETDSAMGQIKVSRPELFEVAYGWYASGLSALTIAGRERCHVDTVYSRRETLHKLIEKIISARLAA